MSSSIESLKQPSTQPYVDLSNATPMMRQYLDIKSKNKNSLLFFRMGDFYELFFEDAVVAASIMDIALTRRGKADNGKEIPMCGVPYHSCDGYIQKLVKAGHNVALCDQMESPEEAKARDGYKAVVRRDVVRIITPGTLTDENLLQARHHNYIASIVSKGNDIAIAYADISTLEFMVMKSTSDNLLNDLNLINPKELIIQDSALSLPEFKNVFEIFKSKIVTFVDSFFEFKKASIKLQHNFSVCTLESLGALSNLQISSCGALIEYICITQKKEKITLSFPKILEKNKFMVVDKTTTDNLELFHSSEEGSKSLLDVLDHTVTNGGGRMLKKFLAFPSVSIKTINDRLDLIEFFVRNANLRNTLREKLKKIFDLERSISKLAVQRGSAHDLYKIKSSLDAAISISESISECVPSISHLHNIASKLSNNAGALEILESVLIDKSQYLNQDDFIKRDYNSQLEEFYNIRDNGSSLLETLREEYRHKTGVMHLKIEFNNVLGYYIEVTKLQADKISCEEFIHRQSTKNNVRFVTNKLKDLEEKIIGAKGNIAILVSQIFEDIANDIVEKSENLTEVAKSISYLDVILSLSHLSVENKYTRPELSDGKDLLIHNGRHPIVESVLKDKAFVPNDLNLVADKNLWLITGPNMAGKSTFLRQNALIVILAHIGSYVPAEYAKVGVVDRVFTRIGAGDYLSKGYSTFLVEMIETATILNQATDRSLVILDEVGRGTSTYDGVAIAWSCLEYIHNNINSRTLFSTHYHELTDLENQLSRLKCYAVQVKEWEGRLIFMYKVDQGIADKSYGINVAEIAGVPKEVITRSEEILQKLHNDNSSSSRLLMQKSTSTTVASDSISKSTLFNYSENKIPLGASKGCMNAFTNHSTSVNAGGNFLHEEGKSKIKESAILLKKKINEINPDELSPKEALSLLYDLKKITS